jgi:hypothetical protein
MRWLRMAVSLLGFLISVDGCRKAEDLQTATAVKTFARGNSCREVNRGTKIVNIVDKICH